jgi:hypothetical protein
VLKIADLQALEKKCDAVLFPDVADKIMYLLANKTALPLTPELIPATRVSLMISIQRAIKDVMLS